jgi:hypothetical protein
MPAFEVTIQIKKDGVDLAGFPFRRTIETNEGSDFNVVKAGGDTAGVYVGFPGLIADTLQLFVAAPDQNINLKLSALADADGVAALLAGGLFLMLNVNQNPGDAKQVEINNVGANPANVKGAWGGS